MRVAAFAMFTLAACAPASGVRSVPAAAETAAVASKGDAADDPAIWFDPYNPAASLILGTDKKAGLCLFALSGEMKQFVPAGALNNVDLRQNVFIGAWRGDLAAATNRTDDMIALFTLTKGEAAPAGAIASALPEPYGLCMGARAGEILVFVTYKTGDVVAYRLTAPGEGVIAARLKFDSQLEGCVFDDEAGVLYLGEEDRGVWKTAYAAGAFAAPTLVDEVGGKTGLKEDIEGLALYKTGAAGYLIVSSQGNSSYAVYERESENRFVGRFAIGSRKGVDGAEETDGIDAISAPLGSDYPQGVLIVQDGRNEPGGATQNYKIVDWRDIEKALGLPK